MGAFLSLFMDKTTSSAAFGVLDVILRLLASMVARLSALPTSRFGFSRVLDSESDLSSSPDAGNEPEPDYNTEPYENPEVESSWASRYA